MKEVLYHNDKKTCTQWILLHIQTYKSYWLLFNCTLNEFIGERGIDKLKIPVIVILRQSCPL